MGEQDPNRLDISDGIAECSGVPTETDSLCSPRGVADASSIPESCCTPPSANRCINESFSRQRRHPPAPRKCKGTIKGGVAKRGRVSRIASRLLYHQPGKANIPSALTVRVPCGPMWNEALADVEAVLMPLAEQQLTRQHLRVPAFNNLLPDTYQSSGGTVSLSALQEQSAEEQRSVSFTGPTNNCLDSLLSPPSCQQTAWERNSYCRDADELAVQLSEAQLMQSSSE